MLATLLAVCLMAGCDRQPTPVHSTLPPTAQASPAIETTSDLAPATAGSAAAASYLSIDKQLHIFPPARMRLDRDGPSGFVVLLHSDDPEVALKGDYVGNSYYFQFEFDLPSDASLDGQTWTFKAESSEPQDTPYGIFLQGRRTQLQPLDVRVEFAARDDGEFALMLKGQFVKLSEDATFATTRPASQVWVEGVLEPKLAGK